MAAEIPTLEPERFVAGDTVKWYREVTDYSAADGWVLTYELRGPQPITVTASQDGTGSRFAVVVSASTTAAYVTGDYKWQAFVTKAGERFRVDDGSIVIEPNWAALVGETEIRSEARQILEAHLETYKRRASRPEIGYAVQAAGRSFNYKSDMDMIKAIQFWQGEVAKETGTSSKVVKMLFV